MSKSVPVFIIFASMLLLGGGWVVYSNRANQIQHELDQVLLVRTLTADSLNVANRKIANLEMTVTALHDSIHQLNGHISKLYEVIRVKDLKIKDLEESIERKSRRYERASNKLQMLETSSNSSQNDIHHAREQVQDLQQSIEKYSDMLTDLQDEKEQSMEQIIDYQVSKAAFEHVTNMVNNTNVRYSGVSFRRTNTGRELTRVGKSFNDWHYAVFQLELQHATPELLLDQKFVLKLVDVETQKVVAHIEANPAYPEKDRKGLFFRFKNNPLELTYINRQPKIGDNLEARIYYVTDKNEEFLLPNGVLQILKNGEPSINPTQN